MSNWLEQLERELDAKLSAFLRKNPVQENLFSEQHLKDQAGELQRQRQKLQREAKQQRQQLLRLAEDVRAWRWRIDRVKAAGVTDLAQRAEQHLTSLMKQGRALWADLEDLGRRFTEVEQQLEELREFTSMLPMVRKTLSSRSADSAGEGGTRLKLLGHW